MGTGGWGRSVSTRAGRHSREQAVQGAAHAIMASVHKDAFAWAPHPVPLNMHTLFTCLPKDHSAKTGWYRKATQPSPAASHSNWQSSCVRALRIVAPVTGDS